MKAQKSLIKILIAVGLFFPIVAFAGGSHSHGADGSHAPLSKISPDQLPTLAQKQLAKAVDQAVKIDGKVLEASWKKVDPKAITVSNLKMGYYSVQMVHPNTGSKVFLLFDNRGVLRDLNSSGKFRGLN